VGEKGANFAGGAFASLVSQTVVVPLDIVSQRMMLSGQGRDVRKTRERPKGFLAVTKQVFRAEGLRGFYRGYMPSIATYAPSSSIWWGSYGLLVPVYYNLMKSWPTDPFWKQGACSDVSSQRMGGSRLMGFGAFGCCGSAVIAQGMSGASAGIITGILTNPMDIVRTKAQVYTQYGAMDTLKYILKNEGPKGLMTGLSAVSACISRPAAGSVRTDLLLSVVARAAAARDGAFSWSRRTSSSSACARNPSPISTPTSRCIALYSIPSFVAERETPYMNEEIA
jgi:solute carrier family 25 protein 44